jgi:hypothetical protein
VLETDVAVSCVRRKGVGLGALDLSGAAGPPNPEMEHWSGGVMERFLVVETLDIDWLSRAQEQCGQPLAAN